MRCSLLLRRSVHDTSANNTLGGIHWKFVRGWRILPDWNKVPKALFARILQQLSWSY